MNAVLVVERGRRPAVESKSKVIGIMKRKLMKLVSQCFPLKYKLLRQKPVAKSTSNPAAKY